MSRRLVVGNLLKSAPIAAALLACPAANAASAQAVFAAENALYGAGYAIGQADGWIDDNLRNALRQYQADRAELATTGELDADTLEALGISIRSSQVVGGNTVASRSAALSELGLSEDRYQQSWSKVAAKPEVEPKPAPESEPAVVSAPEPEVEKEPEPEPKPVEIVASSEPVSQPEQSTTPATAEPVNKKAPEPAPTQSEPEVASVDPSPAPDEQTEASVEAEPDSEPVKITSSFGFSDNSESDFVQVDVEADKAQADVDATLASNSEDVEKSLPQEPTAAGVAPEGNTAATSEEPESGGNVLTRVFDFLFGWMV